MNECECHMCHGRGWVDDLEGILFEDLYNGCPHCKGTGKEPQPTSGNPPSTRAA